MKVLLIIFMIVVVVLCVLQALTRFEVMRLRRKEVAYDAQISVLQERIADMLLVQESELKDFNKLHKSLDAHNDALQDLFVTTNSRLDGMEEKIEMAKKSVREECPFVKKKKTKGTGEQQNS